MSEKRDLSEEDLFGDLDLQPTNNQPMPAPPILIDPEVGKSEIPAPMPAQVPSPRRKMHTTQALKQVPTRSLTGLWIALVIMVVVAGGGLGALYALELPPFAKTPVKARPIVIKLPRRRRAKPKLRKVFFETTPPGAQILINQRNTPYKTPFQLRLIVGRKYVFLLKKKGYLPEVRKINMTSVGEPIKLKVTLKPKASSAARTSGPTGMLFLECWPIGAKVTIALKEQGTCTDKAMRLEIEAGTHPMKIEKEGYIAYTKPLTVTAGDIVMKKVVLEKSLDKPRAAAPPKHRSARRRPPLRRSRRRRGMGRVTITCSPPAVVYWRRKKIGTTPLTYKFPAGRQRITLKNRKIGALRIVTVRVRAHKLVKKSFTFRKGKLKFIIRPWADVYVDGRRVGQTPIPPYKVYEGFHNVELRLKKRRHRVRVRVNGGETTPVIHVF